MNSGSVGQSEDRSGDHLYSLEITGKAIAEIQAAKVCIAAGTPINIAFLGNEGHDQRINAARVIRSCGFEPVPIISSRRLQSQEDLDYLVSNLVGAASPSRFILVGGDPSSPAGPYRDSLALLQSGILERHSIRNVGIVAYPEGHPKIETSALWQALKWKTEFLRDVGCAVEITTQFGFDASAVIIWLRQLRDLGIMSAVRVGVPGPTDVARLLRFAKQFGVVASASIARRYGLSLTNLLQPVRPDRFWDQLADGINAYALGEVLYHLYPFGGVEEGVRWMSERLPVRL